MKIAALLVSMLFSAGCIGFVIGGEYGRRHPQIQTLCDCVKSETIDWSADLYRNTNSYPLESGAYLSNVVITVRSMSNGVLRTQYLPGKVVR